MIARECAGGETGVEVQLEDEGKFGYAPVLRMNLDTGKLQALGWKGKTDLVNMFSALIQDMKHK